MTLFSVIARFVWTEKGTRIHITDTEGFYVGVTRCGCTWTADADADDVLWYGVCVKCRAHSEQRNARNRAAWVGDTA